MILRIPHNTSIHVYWVHAELQILFLCLCSCLHVCKVWMPCCLLLVSVSISKSPPPCIPIPGRFGTENKAIIHSTHARMGLWMCCSHPHYHYARICCCAYKQCVLWWSFTLINPPVYTCSYILYFYCIAFSI